MIQKAKEATLTRKELERRLYKLAVKILEYERIQNEMEQELEEVRRKYSGRLSQRKATIRSMEKALRVACWDSRDRLIPEGQKYAGTMFGKIGFQKQRERLRLQDGVGSGTAAERLEKNGYTDLVRVKKKPDKKAIKEALKEGRVTVELLDSSGLELVGGGEDWWYELDRESVREELEDG